MYYLCIKFHGFWIDWGNGELVTEGVADSFCAIVTIYVSTIYLGIRKPIRRVNYVKIINFFFPYPFIVLFKLFLELRKEYYLILRVPKLARFWALKELKMAYVT